MSILATIALLALALLAGSMAFFSFVVAPLVFARLEPATAGRFIRELFPWYYAVVIGLSLVAAAALAPLLPVAALACGVVLIAGVFARQWLMPAINASSDRIRGNPAARARFRRLHGLSVAINAVQLLLVFAALVALALSA